jgi:2-isopropylmalate synthase
MSREELLALIYDWNTEDGERPIRSQVRLHDETLRDGIQSPSVTDPTIDEKLEILADLDELGVHSVNVGLPAAGPRAEEHTLRLCQAIARQGMTIKPSCAARTAVSDIEPIARVSQAAGVPIEVMAFVGSSAMRWLAEDWSLDPSASGRRRPSRSHAPKGSRSRT